MKTIKITYNGAETEVKFVAGLTKVDFRHHNNLTSGDVTEQADIMYASALEQHAIKVQASCSHLKPTKANQKAFRKGSMFMVRNTLQFDYEANRIEHAELILEYGRKSNADNIKRQQAVKAFLNPVISLPVTSNTSERREEKVA